MPRVKRANRKIQQIKCWPDVRTQLIAGVSLTKIADFIQVKCEELPEWEKTSLIGCLSVERRKLSRSEILSSREPAFFAQVREEAVEALDEIKEMGELFKIQKERILQGRELEKKLMVLNKTLGNEVRIAAEILRSSAAIKKQAGIGSEVDAVELTPDVLVDIRSQYGEKIARVVEDPKKRNRVLQTIQALIRTGDMAAK